MNHSHVMIRDLFSSQKAQKNTFNSLFFGLANKRNIKMEKIKKNSQ